MNYHWTASPRPTAALAAVASVWLLLGTPDPTRAQDTSITPGAEAPAPQAVRPPAGLDDLGWMAGHWQGSREGTQTEELWLPAKGGVMLGVHRDVHPARRRAAFEFLRIETRDDGLYYVALPGGRNSTDFRLAQLEDRRVVFENPEHDFPQRILYWLDAEGALCARVEGEGSEPQEWRWTSSTTPR